MRLILAFALCLLAGAAAAQQPASALVEQRIAGHIGALVLQVTSLGVQVEQLQAELAAARARIRELEPKPDPEK